MEDEMNKQDTGIAEGVGTMDVERIWTAAEVRAELPSIPVKMDEGMCIGHVRGRKLRFAKVHTGWGTVEVAWTTLAHILSRPGRFLRA